MAFFTRITDQYSELWKAIIRPPRDTYEIKDLGPTVFSIENRTYQRTDTQLKNPRGHSLACSHFEPIPSERVSERLPCVVYLHGNCSSRLEAVSTLPVLLPFNITVFCFDFSGSGLSDGEYLSLGYYERDDLAVVVNYLRESNRVTCIGLWGRSMGASTALLHGDRDPSIAGMVLDSPFSDLKVLCEELVDVYVNFKIPRWVVGVALHMVRSSIRANANFDIFDLVPIDHVRNSFIPALFTAAYNDSFIRPHHAKELHEAYAGDKNFVMVEGDHNSARSKFFMDSVAIFFFNTLQCDQLPHQHSHPSFPSSPSRGGQAAGAQGNAPSPARQRNAANASSGDRSGLQMRAPDRGPGFTQGGDGKSVLGPVDLDDEEDMVKQAIEASLKDKDEVGGGPRGGAGNDRRASGSSSGAGAANR
jgi:pimeloyl-ACP methyl ester carboxylesterase